MSTSQHIIALIQSYLVQDDEQFLSIALQAASKEARKGHTNVAQRIRDLVDEARKSTQRGISFNEFLLKDELTGLLTVSEPTVRLADLVLPDRLEKKLKRVIFEHRQRETLLMYNLKPRRKLLLVGPPGTGKTMSTQALAGELHLPLFTVTLEGVISKYMGETAIKLKMIFEAMISVPGIYFFDEFDAIGSKRTSLNDVGEIRRVLNSFLQLIENDWSESLVVAATNHPELLDKALFRRFDDVMKYELPDIKTVEKILKNSLLLFDTKQINWEFIIDSMASFSPAEITKIALEAAKIAVLDSRTNIIDADFYSVIEDHTSAFE